MTRAFLALGERTGRGLPTRLADRGFTGHEYLEDFKLYNMNGRLYDPVVGRFLSPDPYVQDPSFTQSLNRYSYCLNNPLKFTDPTGEKLKWPKFEWSYLIPVIGQLDYVMQTINDNTEKLRNNMAKAGIPSFSIGTSVGFDGDINFNASYRDQEVFNTEYIDRSNAEIKVEKEIARVNGRYGGEWKGTSNGFDPKMGRIENPQGHIVSVANGTVALGPVGVTADIGAVFDGYGQGQMYFTFGWAYGFGATAGVGYSRTNKGFKVTDYAGSASAVMLSIPFTPLGVEGFGDYYEGATEAFHIGTKTKGIGGNIGVGAGWFGVQTFTIIFNPPSPDFWLRPRPRW